MERIFLSVLNMSLTGTFVIAAIMIARLPLKKAPKSISYALWAVAGFRLVFPFSIQSVFSLLPFNAAPIPQDIARQAVPRIDSGIMAVDDAVSAALPAAAPVASVNPLQAWLAVCAYIWLFGIAVLLIYSVVSIISLKRRFRGAARVEGNLYETDRMNTPFVIGLFRPKIYIPAGLSGEERRFIILHEQTHIRRYDHAVKMFAYLVMCLHWFNPMAWIAFVLMGADMEMSCDERVMKELGGGIKSAYSLSLVRVAAGHKILNGSPLAFGEGGMKERIKNVLNFKKHSRVIIIAAVALAAVLSVGLTLNRAAKDGPVLSDLGLTSGTYYLENPTERQKLERLASVTLYEDGRARLMPALISSYLPPDCTAAVEDGELLLRAEGGPGLKAGDILARFTILDEKTLVFQSAAVPLFADEGARYICVPNTSSKYQARKWLDYYFDEQMPWNSSLELELPEFSGVTFKWTSEKVTVIESGGEKELLWGMPIWNVYLADLTGDGLPELCATVSFGSGMIDERVIVCDYAAGKTYELSDRGYYDYALSLENGRLMVKQTKYLNPQGDALAVGELTIVDGVLVGAGIDRTLPAQERRAMTIEDVRNLAGKYEKSKWDVPVADLLAELASFEGQATSDTKAKYWVCPITGGKWRLEVCVETIDGAEHLSSLQLVPYGFPFKPQHSMDLRKGIEDYIAYVESYDGTQTTLTGAEESAAHAAALAYEKKLFGDKVIAVERITDLAKFEGAVIVSRVKGKVAAFDVDVDDGDPVRTIILTQTSDGAWEVINEGY